MPDAVTSAGDAELLRMAAGGNAAAFEALLERHQPALARLVRAATATREDAEDAFQEACLSAYRAAGTFRGEASVRTWLLTIARHAAYRARRRGGVEDATDDETLAELGVRAGWGDQSPERDFAAAERADVLRAALDSLAPQDREILVLRDLEELSGDDVARALGLTMAAMKSRLHRARLRLAAAVHGRVT